METDWKKLLYRGEFKGERDGDKISGSHGAKFLPESDIEKLLHSQIETLVGAIENMEKSFGDTGKPDGYCNFCLDHVSQHGENKCGCDYYNCALREVKAVLTAQINTPRNK